ncbi:hypothetical protein AC792_10465 [Arthrobacter sp. RIT-PI-e]|uniref:hypothetical protein n=1 Tax=Arthrobacter sp. RIT-PI-e TaxID=1681197 RepID=UPI000675CB6A|nr:hypothetical protein [Arthrobacter sp. RIT-PI-e]KNC18710.1 hypothetical protein AC792_10465 [Arthrobacter sp. RIT-PI-e]
MTENAHGGHIVNPNEGDGSTSDPNWHGDLGDQGNDLRFAEEQALIKEQAERAERDPAEAVAASQQEGHYTANDADGSGVSSSTDPADEGEYTDTDR